MWKSIKPIQRAKFFPLPFFFLGSVMFRRIGLFYSCWKFVRGWTPISQKVWVVCKLLLDLHYSSESAEKRTWTYK